MEEIKSLHNISIDEIFAAREEAFHNYEMKLSKNEFIKMLHRRRYSSQLSFGAFSNQKLVSFTLNGVGLFSGKSTAYDMGTGTLPEYHGKGLASKVFTASLPVLKQSGVQQYLLEVLQHNAKAISVYTKLGFRVTREFNYFIQEDIKAVRLAARNGPIGLELRTSDLTHAEAMATMWDFTPSWQNNFEALSKNPADFEIIGAFSDGTIAGYGIIEPATGDIPQIAVGNAYKRQGVGSAILQELLALNQRNRVKMINTESICGPLTAFLENSGIPKCGMQFEMIKDIQ
jgi:ribosomal protein S18 acetylase RimI-like enzyme